jgi:hypothetical protein
MFPEDFELLLELMRPFTEKKYTPFRNAMPETPTVLSCVCTGYQNHQTATCEAMIKVLAHALYTLSRKTCFV